MSSRGCQRPGARAARSSHRGLRGVTAILAAGLILGACGGAAVSPSPGTTSSASPSQPGLWTLGPWTSGPTWSPWPTAEEWTEEPFPWDEETPAPTAWPSIAPADFQMARGTVSQVQPARDKGAAAATRINDFGFDLFRHLDPNGNLCVSPTSIALAMAMLRPGAVGTTGTEMDTVLHQFGGPGQSAEIVALLQQLSLQTVYGDEYGGPLDPGATADPYGNPTPLIELRVANQVFSQQGMSLEKSYLDALGSYGAGMGLLDFKKDPEAARLTVNKWVNYATRGRIPDVLQPGDVDDMTRIAIANAIYLNAPWEAPFSPDETKPLPFTTRAGTKVNVPTMSGYLGHLDYAAGTGYRAAQMWLSYPGTMSVTIIVPDDMAAFTSSLTAAKLGEIGFP
jgi:serpin B